MLYILSYFICDITKQYICFRKLLALLVYVVLTETSYLHSNLKKKKKGCNSTCKFSLLYLDTDYQASFIQ